MHWQLPKKIWAHPHLLAASTVTIMDPSKVSSSFYLKNNGPTHKHLMGPSICIGSCRKKWAYPHLLAASTVKNIGPSKISSSFYFKNSGPTHKCIMGPSICIGAAEKI